jgi:hypothetical protein
MRFFVFSLVICCYALSIVAIDLDWDNLSKHKSKELRKFLKERGVDDSAVMGGEKSELYRLVRESKDLPIKEAPAEDTAKAKKDPKKDKDLKEMLEKLQRESGMGFKMFTADDIKNMDPEKLKDEL